MTSIGERLGAAIGSAKVVTAPAELARLSRDFYWYSQVLEAELRYCIADVVVQPASEADVLAVLRLAQYEQVGVTVRGAGTGNYGQAVPLFGGIVMDMTRMNAVLDIGEGWMRVQAGARMGALENAARRQGQELCLLPSTFEKSTVAGFICGGAGGLGSVTHGWLWDGNVIGCRMVTAEIPPRALELQGEDVAIAVHGYGLTGVLTEVTIPLTAMVEWTQIVTTFPDFDKAIDFATALTLDSTIRKRLVSSSEAGLGALFNVALKILPDPGRHPVFLLVACDDRAAVAALVEQYGGTLDREIVYGKHPMLSDFSFNHVTLWAKKNDPAWTYIQAGFKIDQIHDQLAQVKARFGESILHHFEHIRIADGSISPGGLLLVKYKSAGQLDEIMAYLESLGIWVSNPHTYLLEGGARRQNQWSAVRAAKPRYDPAGILNPGKTAADLETVATGKPG